MSGRICSKHLPNFLDIDTEDISYKCIYALWRQEFRRCRNPVNKADRSTATALKEEILQCSDKSYRQTLLTRYATLCCCLAHHRTALSNDPFLVEQTCKRWAEEVDRIRAGLSTVVGEVHSADGSSPTPSLARDHADAANSAKCLEQDGTDPPAHPLDRLRDSHSRRRRKECIIERSSSHAESDSAHFVPYATEPDRTLSQSIRRRLLPSEHKSGVLYLFTRPSDQGFVKIGVTQAHPSVRLRAWKTKCQYIPCLEFAVYDVPNAPRVEYLVQRELWRERRKEPRCRHNAACVTKHQEWFEIDVQRASAVVQRWATWMREARPYTSAGDLQTIWDDQLKNLEQLETLPTSEVLLETMKKMSTGMNVPTSTLTRRETPVSNRPSLDATSLTLLNTLATALLDLQDLMRAKSQEQDGRPVRELEMQSAPVFKSSLAALQEFSPLGEPVLASAQVAVV